MGRIDKLREIVSDKQSEEIDGVLVDVTTAKLILMCYDAGNDVTKKTIETYPIASVGRTAWSLVTEITK